jgi:2-polyprenyl-6-methoxyphenol hydroxylase-like FAD-dependent oxidoreductase
VTIAPVLIIGAGPVGLTLANELARRSIPLRIIDKVDAIREVSKALILHVRTQEALLRLGVMDDIRREARSLTEVAVFAYGDRIGSWDLDGFAGPCPCPLIIGQNRTQHILADRLKSSGVNIEWGVEATGLDIREDGVTATLKSARGEEEMEASYIIGCEGSDSLVRKTLQIAFEGERYYGEQFIQADCRIRWPLPAGRSYLFLTRVGYMMVIEMPHGLVRIFISLPDKQGAEGAEIQKPLGAVEAVSEMPTLEEIATEFKRLSGLPCELSDPIWLARYRTSHRYANAFRKGRAFIAGDAGHVHVPIGGQGMNTGIQDAFNLGWKLAGVINGFLAPVALDSYDAERRPIAESLIKGTNFAYRGILHPSALRQRMTRWIGPHLMSNKIVQNFMRNTLEELRINYPASPLNADLGGSRGPAPGDRAPDPILVQAEDASTVRVTDLDQAGCFQMLLFSGVGEQALSKQSFIGEARSAEAWAPGALCVYAIGAQADYFGEDGFLLDSLGEAHASWGVRAPAAFIVRPDGVVAARGQLASWRKLIGALAAWAPVLSGGQK